MFPTPLPPTSVVGSTAPPSVISSPPPIPSPPGRRRTSIADSIALPSYIVDIYNALTPEEQDRTQQLVAMLTQEERVQWLIELGTLTLPDAIARVRDLIRPTTPQAARPVRRLVMIHEPYNDTECLGPISQKMAEMVAEIRSSSRWSRSIRRRTA